MSTTAKATKQELEEETAIAIRPAPIVRAAGSPADIAGALNEYRAIQAQLDRAMPEAVMSIEGKPFRKKAYWRAVGNGWGLNVFMVSERRVDLDGDWGYEVLYRAEAPNGRAATGDGSCFASEKTGKTEQGTARLRTVHNIRSHAHTRAYNRAVSNLVGFGEVSAEEMISEEHNNGAPVGQPAPARAPSGKKTVTEKQQKMLWAKAKARSEQVGGRREEVMTAVLGVLGVEHTADITMDAMDEAIALINDWEPEQLPEAPF